MGKNKKDRFVCWIQVPAFVARYLMQNYKVSDSDWPELVSLRDDEYLYSLFRSRLVKPTHRYDNRLEQRTKFHNRSCRVAVEITKDDFYNHGWSLSATDENTLVRAMEIKVHTLCLTFLASAYMVTPVLRVCIDEFYRRYGFDENTWPSDSIRRLWTRTKSIDKSTLRTVLIDNINKIVIGKLSLSGTISQQGKELYEDIGF
jgi:hypothetical protein